MKKMLFVAILALVALSLAVSVAMADGYTWAPWTENVTLWNVVSTPQGNLPALQVNLEGALDQKNPGYRKAGNSHGILAGVVAGYNCDSNRGKYSVDATVTWLDEQTEVLVAGSASELFELVWMPVRVSSKNDGISVRIWTEGTLRQALRQNRATKVATWAFNGGFAADEYRAIRKDGAEFYVLVVIGKGVERTVTRKSNGGSNGGNGGSSNPPSGGDDPATPEVRPDPQSSDIGAWDENPYHDEGSSSSSGSSSSGSSSSGSSGSSSSGGSSEFTVTVNPNPQSSDIGDWGTFHD